MLLISVCVCACQGAPEAALEPSQSPAPQLEHFDLASMPALRLAHHPVTVDRQLTIHGKGFAGTSVGPWVHFNDIEAPSVEIVDDTTLVVLVPEAVSGLTTVRVTNPDGQSKEKQFSL
jgi:hypothetical protein